MINLPQAPGTYDPRDQQNLRAALAQADSQNQKKNTDFEVGRARFVMQSPNGARWQIGVTDSGQVGTGGVGPVPTLTHGHIFVGNASNLAADVAMSGDASIADTGAISVTKTGGVTFGYFATGTDASHLTGTLNSAQLPALADAKIWIGNGSSVPTAQTVSGDGTLADTGALSITKTGGVTFGYYATGTDAANLTGTLNNARLSAVPNSALANSSVTLNSHALSLGGTLTLTATDIYANWSTSGGIVTHSLAGGGSVSYGVQGEGATTLVATRYSTNANGPQMSARKARGTIALPTVVVQNDILFQQVGSGYDGTSAFQNSTNMVGRVIEPTPSPTAMGGQFTFLLSPLGSVTPTEVCRMEAGTGLSMFGANPVIDQNRTHIFNSSTVAGLPTLVTAGNRFATDLEGGQGNVYGGAAVWRNAQNNQLAVNTITGQGVLSKMTGYFNFNQRALVNGVMQKLSDAGLLSKLLGLWVHAVPTNSTDALLNWITPGTRNAAIIGSPTWTANQGFTGDGSTALIDSAASLTTFGATINNVSVGCYVRTAGTGSAKAVIGCDNVAQARRMYLQTFTSGALVARCNDQTNDNYTPASYTGLFVMSRSVSTGFNASRNDDAASTITRTSVTQTSSVAFLGTADSTASEFSNAQIAFSFIATALSTTDIANLRWIMVDYFLVGIGAIAADYTVATLPLASTPPKGTRLNVTDGAAAPVFAAVPTGGGSLYLPVMTDSAAWHYG